MKGILIFLAGLVLGGVAMGGTIWAKAPDVAIRTTTSPVGLEATIERLKQAAEAEDWVVQGVVAIDESVRKHGAGEILPVRLVNLCHPGHAATILRQDDARRVSVFMPCTIAVYETSDGKVHMASMNADLLGRMFGGVVADVMGGEVAAAQERFVAAAAKPE